MISLHWYISDIVLKMCLWPIQGPVEETSCCFICSFLRHTHLVFMASHCWWLISSWCTLTWLFSQPSACVNGGIPYHLLHIFFFPFAQAHKKVCFLWTQSTRVVSNSASLWTVTCQAPLPWNSPGKHTGVSCHSLLQGIFVIQGLNSGFLNCRFFTDWVTREAHKAE